MDLIGPTTKLLFAPILHIKGKWNEILVSKILQSITTMIYLHAFILRLFKILPAFITSSLGLSYHQNQDNLPEPFLDQKFRKGIVTLIFSILHVSRQYWNYNFGSYVCFLLHFLTIFVLINILNIVSKHRG